MHRKERKKVVEFFLTHKVAAEKTARNGCPCGDGEEKALKRG